MQQELDLLQHKSPTYVKHEKTQISSHFSSSFSFELNKTKTIKFVFLLVPFCLCLSVKLLFNHFFGHI